MIYQKKLIRRGPCGLRGTKPHYNSLAHRTTWLRSDLEEEIKKNNITRITFKITENDSKSFNDLPEEINYEKINGNHESGERSIGNI